MSDFLARLAELDTAYEAAPELGGLHPEFKGVGTIEAARIEESKMAGDNTLYLNVHVKTDLGMAFLNIRLTNFSSEKQLSFTKGQLANIGHADKLSTLNDTIPGLIGSGLEIDVQHNAGEGKHEGKTFANVYARKLVTAPANVWPVSQAALPTDQAMAAQSMDMAAGIDPTPVQAAPSNSLPFN